MRLLIEHTDPSTIHWAQTSNKFNEKYMQNGMKIAFVSLKGRSEINNWTKQAKGEIQTSP